MAGDTPEAKPAPQIHPIPKRTRPRLQAVTTGTGTPPNLVVLGSRPPGLSDVYHALVRARWSVTAGVMAGSFLVVNVLFAALYYAVGGVAEIRPDSFLDLFFFSVETMGTIGYGVMHPATVEAHFLTVLETMVGMFGVALATGLVFAKFSRPKARVMFSNVAVVSDRDRVPTLMFRVGNERRNYIMDATLKVTLLKSVKTAEGEQLRRLIEVPLIRTTSPAFVLSWTAMHSITPQSPLWGETPQSLMDADVELLVNFMGIDEVTSQTIHARHSYAPEEILYGARLVDIFGSGGDGKRVVDYGRFHDVQPWEVSLPWLPGKS
ncbi:MAG TPA: ion channel [Myxococcales bacterium]|nr:ion channel [Myxococcales bacterium]